MDRVRGRKRRPTLLSAVEGLEPRLFMSATHVGHHHVRGTPLPMPSHISVTAGASGVQVQWAPTPSASGYYVLRQAVGKGFSRLAQITSTATTTYTDTEVSSDHIYKYAVQAYSGQVKSSVSKRASITTPMAAPSGLGATSVTAASIQLKWTDNDRTATGYNILRSTDGIHFSQIAKLSGTSVSSYIDNKVLSGNVYDYEVQAFSAKTASGLSNIAIVTTPLAAPSALSGAFSANAVGLNWKDNDANATGYLVLRSMDGVNFSTLAQLSSASATTFADASVSVGQTYYYEVEAQNAVTTSAASNSASITPSSDGSAGVVISTRYGNELTITASGTSDSISIAQSGSSLTILADGQTFTDSAPAGGLFVYTRGGTDTVGIGSSVTVRTTLDTIDGASTSITSAGSNVSVWIDSTDSFSGTGGLHSVASFAGGVSKAPGASLSDPTDSGSTFKVNASLWGTGPVANDVNQGEIGDCYFLSTLAAFAGTNPAKIQNSAVDLGDGTFAVQFFANGTPTYLRVNNDFSSGPFGGYMYAHPGANGTLWAAVMEKAYCYFRSGANTYSSIDSGWMGDVYTALNVNNTFFVPSNYSESGFYNMVQSELASGKPITVACLNGPNLVNDHAYTLVSASKDTNGTTHYVVRNPWGTSGDSLENSQGYATLTFSQLTLNFAEGCMAA